MKLTHCSPLFGMIAIVWSSFGLLLGQQTQPLKNAHAHNDYEHERPLLDALSQGFTSIEVDIHLIDEELYVAHDRPLSRSPEKTLEALYLAPLKRLVEHQEGSVFPGFEQTLYLMIDIKTDAEKTFQVLYGQLSKYAKILSSGSNGHFIQGPVTIFLSGNRPIESVLRQTPRLTGIDGRPADLATNYSAEFMPVVSDRYGKHFKWQGKGPMPKKEWEHLRALTTEAHQQGKKVRFWASPEKEVVWETLLQGGADLISTDQLKKLNAFLRSKN